jgi:glycerol-3-phosphate dehydrogenase
VIVVGAGFYGVTGGRGTRRQRGLSVAIIDKDDSAPPLRSTISRLCTAGLRSLTALNFTQMRLFIRERRALARILPHLVWPAAFRGGTTAGSRRGARRHGGRCSPSTARWRVIATRDLADPGQAPAGQPDRVARGEALRLNPVVAPGEASTGGRDLYDYQMLSTDRVTLSFLLSAVEPARARRTTCRRSASSAERPRHRRARRGSTDATNVRDSRHRGRECRRPVGRAPARRLPAAAQGAPPPALSRAMNVVTRKVVNDHACGGLVNGRYLFMVPWRDVSMLGTSHDAHDGPPIS